MRERWRDRRNREMVREREKAEVREMDGERGMKERDGGV